MPVVTFPHGPLCNLIGKEIPLEELGERMPMLGGDLDHVGADEITIEWFPDRPDLLTLEGAARSLRAFFGIQPGMPTYEVRRPTTKLVVDPSVADVRPYAALCFVRGVRLDDEAVRLLMDAQEKLCLTMGRKRRKVAIGIHDADGVEGPFRYTTVGPDEVRFVPLQDDTARTPAQIVAEHPKGQEYGHLVEGRYPVFLDGAGEVLSMPPVINAARTMVTAATTDLLLDVTGTDADAVRRTIALLATGFAERGGTIEAVEVHDASGKWTCPDLRPTETTLHVDDVHRLLGLDLSADTIAEALQRMGHHAEDYDTTVLVQSPAWRFDLLHPVDWMEDVAIGYGFDRFPGSLPKVASFGGALPLQDVEDRLRRLLTGHGFQEAKTLTLSNPAAQWTHWGEAVADAVTIKNPALEEQTLLRVRLAPSLLQVLARNRHRPLPQRLFEVGYVVVPTSPPRNRLRVAAVESGAKVGVTDVRSLTEALLRDLGVVGAIVATDRAGFIPGRHAAVQVDGAEVGHFGELHLDTLTAFGLGAATTVLELDVEALAHP